MALIKTVKNKAYFKKFQVKLKRRRQAKTVYKARRKMVRQDKNKYNAPKYRLVARITNRNVICQVVWSTIEGDKVLCRADSHELPRYGIPCGLANFAAAYATGLLVARRLLKQLDMEDTFEGVTEATGEEFHIEEEGDEDTRRPFKCILDVGLARTTVGAKCFACMKGAVDGGLHIPHSTKRFPGYQAPTEKGAEGELDADAFKARILGGHVSDYMTEMKEEDVEKYNAHFAKYIEQGKEADDLEDMYLEAHQKIREDPTFVKKERGTYTHTRTGGKVYDGKTSYNRNKKKTLKQRKATVKKKIQAAQAALLAAAAEAGSDDDEEDDEE